MCIYTYRQMYEQRSHSIRTAQVSARILAHTLYLCNNKNPSERDEHFYRLVTDFSTPCKSSEGGWQVGRVTITLCNVFCFIYTTQTRLASFALTFFSVSRRTHGCHLEPIHPSSALRFLVHKYICFCSRY